MPNISARTVYRFATLAPQDVYAAWVEPEKVNAWMQRNLDATSKNGQITRIETNPVVGGRYLFAGVQDGEVNDAWGTYRVVEPGRRIVFTWFVEPDEEAEDNSTVTLELEPDGDGTRATITHEMDGRWVDYKEQTVRAWASMLKAIDDTFG